VSKLTPAILPAYVFLCLLIGGSTQGIWANAVLQLLAIAIIGWAVLTREPQAVPVAARRLLWIAGGIGLLFVIQLVPLPPAVWTALPGRELIASGFDLLGVRLPWLPLSMAPYDTAAAALTLLPPLAVLIGMVRLQAWTVGGMLGAIVLAAVLSVLLGVLQVTGGDGSWYFYRITNLGVAVGTFANGNHFATFLLAAIPLLAGLGVSEWRTAAARSQRRSLTAALSIAAAAVFAVGILINGSAAIFLLGPPVAVATMLLAMWLSLNRLRQGLVAIALLLAVAAALLVTVGKDLPGWGTSASIETRTEYWAKTVAATKEHGLAGSGFGTFRRIYRQQEDPGTVNRWYVNHAHNDYLELALEGGVGAVLLLALFLFWWTGRARDAWLAPTGTPEQKAVAVASAVILLHSSFDYPLRTAAVMALMAACLAILAGARGASRGDRADGRPKARHATL
jgi:O-antigen ligase